MREKSVPAVRQYELIMECRNSGLSDAQWCREHGIKPGTFYGWVSKLKKKACYDIPEPNGRLLSVPSLKQDVVKIDIKKDKNAEKITKLLEMKGVETNIFATIKGSFNDGIIENGEIEFEKDGENTIVKI